jgi:hypothetical protein
VRAGLWRRPELLAVPLLRAKQTLRCLGSDLGGMAVTLDGKDGAGASRRLVWSLIARRGHGPYIPSLAAVILAKGLMAGTLKQRGAMPCLGLFTLADFLHEAADLDITAANP